MTTTITKNFISNDNVLYKARTIKKYAESSNSEVIEQIKKDGRWIDLTERGKYIKTKTLYCTNVNHKSGVSKVFTEGKRFQVNMHAGLGQNAGYIYDKDGNAWQLYRDEEVGFKTLCETYRFQAQYK